jgi:hypothetical protein
MEYLIYQLAWWLVAAFAIGLVTGWLAGSHRRRG